MKIIVTGSTGFLGSHLMPKLKDCYGNDHVIGVSSVDFDLMKQHEVDLMLQTHKPDVLIHLAAYSGGIGANNAYPADFFYRNSLLTTLVFESASRHGVKKMIYPMGGCSYPAAAVSPISEDQMWGGYPQIESAGYSMAKKMGIVLSQTFRKQYGFNSVVLIPGNMYGEFDNFRLTESHVIPAMIRRYYEAMLEGQKTILMWGDGSPVRDFVYAGDVANNILWFIDNYDSSEPINISSGVRTTIKELAETIRLKMGWSGEIVWDINQPNGQMIKTFDVSKLSRLGLTCPTSLSVGLENTINWFAKNYTSSPRMLRL